MLPTTEHRTGPTTGTRKTQILATLAAYREGREEVAELERVKSRTTEQDARLLRLQELQISRAKALRDLPAGDAELGKLVAEGLRP